MTAESIQSLSEALRKANARLDEVLRREASVLDALPAHVAILDSHGVITSVNKAWRTFGARSALASANSGIGMNYLEVCDKANDCGVPQSGVVARAIRSVLAGRRSAFTTEYPCDLPGETRWFKMAVAPMNPGQACGALVMHLDITERKQAEQALRENQDALEELNAGLEDRVRRRTIALEHARQEAETANRAKSDFLATMSHEIRTPMSGVMGLLELLELSPLNDDQQVTLTAARESGSSLLRLIDDILDFSRIEANGLELQLSPTSLAHLVEGLARLHSQVASSKNLLLHTDIAPQISPLLLCDPLRVRQILNNFLNNAIKFTESGSVTIRVELLARGQDTERLMFSVRDTGIGMTQAQMSRLFQPFGQASAETAARFGGTGLGLVISRRLAGLMGGTVDLESEPGAGTTLRFVVELAICDPGLQAAPARTGRQNLAALVAGRPAAPPVETARAQGTLILVVDDHPTNRMVLTRQLALLGYATQTASDGRMALEALRGGQFGAVIMDCNMPGMNGYEVARAIRDLEQHSPGTHVPIIACTANALPSARAMCMAAGMDDCVVKPIDLAVTSQLLERWMPQAAPAVPAGALQAPLSRASPIADAPGLIDGALLHDLADGDAATQAGILRDFRRANELDVSSLRLAIHQNRFAQMLESSHRIKGSASMLGATLLARACETVEAAAVLRDRESVRRAAHAFDLELSRLNDYIETFSNEN